MKTHFTIDGVKDLRGNVERTIIRVRKDWSKNALIEAQTIMEESLQEVPIDTEALAHSAFVTQLPNGDVDFGYGADNVQMNPKSGELTDEYMMDVHEDLNTFHPHGKAKFLEDPVNRSLIRIEAHTAKSMKRAMREGRL